MRKSFAGIAVGAAVVAAALAFLVYAIGHSGRSVGGSGYNLTAAFDRIDGLPQGADLPITQLIEELTREIGGGDVAGEDVQPRYRGAQRARDLLEPA